ncbi:phosphate ABC transporter permease subunit PstC [Hippea alviniae]|uniref:phosphate ABC transporter permease subunit PstC n=1 Tax=Hippea alviniae TaxID=1279027 RepID=UPI0003B709D1|nr:phosphate ABC transporter permease subunit PstC [Hippea alviniae]
MRRRTFAAKDKIFLFLTVLSSILTVAIVVAMFIVLLIASLDAIKHFGVFHFIFHEEWNPPRHIFGGASSIYGTIMTTIIALLFAIPTSFGIAIFITQICPKSLKGIFSSAIELLATIPSIIYGMWGLFSLAPVMRNYIEPALQKVFFPIPGLRILFEGTPLGIDLLTAGLVLSIMIIPFIASIARDNFELTPKELSESAYAMGATKWEVIKDVIIPYSKVGLLSGIIIATGRALGETMAVAFVLGNDHSIHLSLLKSSTTIAVTLANEFTEADFNLYVSSLFYLGFILLFLSFFLLSIAKFLVKKGAKRDG